MQRTLAPTQRQIDWDDARILLAMLRARTLAEAARSLGIDKSTCSRRLETIEQSLKTRLFIRSREGMRPSAAGERLRVHAERIETEIRSLQGTAASGDEEIRGLVRIATTEGMASRLVKSGLLDITKTHPGIDLELIGGNRPVDLARGEADLAVRVTPTKDPSLKVKVLGRFGISLFASPQYLHTRGVPRNQAQLEGHDVLLPSGELAVLPEAKWMETLSGIRVAFRSSSMPALVEASIRGHGLCAITRSWGEAEDGLEHVFELDHIPARPTWLVVHPDVAKRGAVRVVADSLAEAFRAATRR